MREKTVYICEICNGVYENKELAGKCEESGYPKYYNEFIGKWIFLPVQVFIDDIKENFLKMESKIKWRLVRIEGNIINEPKKIEILRGLNMSIFNHSLSFSTRSFENITLIKDFLKYAIIVPEKYYETINNKLVEKEISYKDYSEARNEFIEKTNEWIIKEMNINLPTIEGKDKHEYISVT